MNVDEIVASGREYEAALDALPDGIFLFDAGTRLSFINNPGKLLENRPEALLIGRRCCEMFWGVEASECVVDRALAGGQRVEVEMLAGANADRPTLVSVTPIKALREKGAISALVVARDISELRRAKAEAFEHKSFMASLADLTPDEIYTLDTEGHIKWMNERAEAASGLTRSVLVGREFSWLIAPEAREAAAANLQRTFRGEDTQAELQAICADGTVRYVEAHTSPMWKDGSITGALIFLRDVTDRKRTQDRMAQSDKLRALGELAAGVAHNLNNSLTVIQGRAQLLQMRSADAAAAKSLEVIARAVADSSQTLRRLLDFARRDTSQDFVPLDLTELITSSVEIARPKWQNTVAGREGRINVIVVNQGLVRTLGDGAELREVVINMLFNAVDAMPDGGTIEVGTRAEIDGACFWVADTGCGMPPEVAARVFEPFYTTKGERGTGLGLAASHGIIARHNGQILVASYPGEGTRFEVRLPLYEKSLLEKKAPVFVPASNTMNASVLVVDDDERVRSLLADAFKDAGHRVFEAATGTEAIARLDETELDLVVCDLGLPGVSGLQISRRVKERLPKTLFILATGWSDMIRPEDYEEGRIDAVFKKPYAVTDLLERAAQLLGAAVDPTQVETRQN